LLAPEFVHHDLAALIVALAGVDATANFLKVLRRGLPDLRLEIEDIWAPTIVSSSV
jgi:hypothetical protein